MVLWEPMKKPNLHGRLEEDDDDDDDDGVNK